MDLIMLTVAGAWQRGDYLSQVHQSYFAALPSVLKRGS